MNSHRPILILLANLKGNLGDFAILHAMLVLLETRYPGREKHVFSLGHLEIDERRMNAFLGEPHPAFSYKGVTPYRRLPRTRRIIRMIGLKTWRSGKLMDRLSGEFKGIYPISAVKDYETTYLAGGEQWSGFSSGITMFAILMAVSEINPSVHMLPFSVRKILLESYSRGRLERCFRRITGKLIVRDGGSAGTMKRISPRVVHGADCVFSLADLAMEIPAPLEKHENLIIIAVAQATGSFPEDILAISLILVGAGFRVRLLTTCEPEDGPKMSVLARSPGIEYSAPATWQEAVSELKSAAMVITNRLHSLIFTIFADVPVVPLLNREKIVGVFEDAGLTHSLEHIRDLTPSKVLECMKDRELVLAKMRSYLERTRRMNMAP